MHKEGLDSFAPKIALCLVILSFCFCLWHKFRSFSQVPKRFGQESDYIEIAEEYDRSKVLQSWRPPLYSAIAALHIRVFGRDKYLHSLAAFQAVMLLLLYLAVWHIAVVVGGKARWGLLSVSLTALNLRLGLEFLSLRETFAYCLLLLVFFRLALLRECTERQFFLLGLLSALLWLTRPTGLLVAPAFWFAFCHFEKSWAIVKSRLAGKFVLGMLCPILLWLGYLHYHAIELHISGNAAWENLYRSYNRAIGTYYPWIQLNKVEPHMRKLRARWKNEDKDADAAFMSAALVFIKDNPTVSLKLLPVKALSFFWPGHIPFGAGDLIKDSEGNWSVENYKAFHWRRHLAGFAALPALILSFIGLLGMGQLPRATRFAITLFFATAILHTVLHSLTRHRLPFDPLLTIAAISILKALKPHWFKLFDELD